MGTTSPKIPNTTFVHELIDNSLKIQWTTIYINICNNKLYASQKSLKIVIIEIN